MPKQIIPFDPSSGDTLTTAESTRLEELEAVIERNMDAVVAVEKALREIQENNLTSFVDRSPGGHGGVRLAPEALRDDDREEAKPGRAIRDPLQRFAIDFRAVRVPTRLV
jgi:hypothetical protein